MALENYRITEFQEKTQVDNGDYVLIDSATDGTHKYQLSRIPAQASAEVAAAVAAEKAAREAADAAEVTARNAAIAANVDNTLSVSGKAADAKKTGDEIADVKSDLNGIFTDEMKDALLACFRHVIWKDALSEDYYDDLYEALYGEAPEPDVPDGYTKYDYIRLKKWTEVQSGVYDSRNNAYVIINGQTGKSARISTDKYDNLNALSYKIDFYIEPRGSFSENTEAVLLGGRTQSGISNALCNWVNLGKTQYACATHGTQMTINQSLNDRNTLEIINGNASPTTIIMNGTQYSFNWTNSNVVNMYLTYFSNCVESETNMTCATYIRMGRVEIKDTSGTLVSVLVPVLRTSDNVIGVYDIIKNKFYTPALSRYATVGNSYCIYELGNYS